MGLLRWHQTIAQAKFLRKRQTEAEQILWRKLRNRNFFGYKFRRQVAIGPFIADFLCAEKKLIIELDSFSHSLQKEKDVRRDQYLKAHGYHVLRLPNARIQDKNDDGLGTVSADILAALSHLPTQKNYFPLQRESEPPSPTAVGEGRGEGLAGRDMSS